MPNFMRSGLVSSKNVCDARIVCTIFSYRLVTLLEALSVGPPRWSVSKKYKKGKASLVCLLLILSKHVQIGNIFFVCVCVSLRSGWAFFLRRHCNSPPSSSSISACPRYQSGDPGQSVKMPLPNDLFCQQGSLLFQWFICRTKSVWYTK